jgi:hypothetical protein
MLVNICSVVKLASGSNPHLQHRELHKVFVALQ